MDDIDADVLPVVAAVDDSDAMGRSDSPSLSDADDVDDIDADVLPVVAAVDSFDDSWVVSGSLVPLSSSELSAT